MTDHKYRFWILKVIAFFAEKDYLFKLLRKHKATLSSKNLKNISKFEGWGIALVAYKKLSVVRQVFLYDRDFKMFKSSCESLWPNDLP